jgi:hypothetical protein
VNNPYKAPRSPIDDLKRTLRWIGVFVGGILLGVIICGGAVLTLLNDKTNEIIRVRDESRLAACIKDRDFQVAHNALAASTIDLVRTSFTASAAAKRTRAERESTLAFMRARIDDLSKNVLPVRHCDRTSIDAFYKPATTTTTEVMP